MAVCNCHNCRFVLPEAIKLLDRIGFETDVISTELYEDIMKFMNHTKKEGIA